jgi:hypothetical protein
LVELICRYLFSTAFIEEVNGQSGNYSANVKALASGMTQTKTDSFNTIKGILNSSDYYKIVLQNRPPMNAIPTIINGKNTIYNPILAGSSNKPIFDLRPVYDDLTDKTYLYYSLDLDAYGLGGLSKTALEDVAKTNGLNAKRIDFDMYIDRYISELIADKPELYDEIVLELRPEIGRRLLTETESSGSNTGALSDIFALPNEYDGVPVKNGTSLADLLSQSVTEKTPVAEISTTEANTQVWDNSTITFARLQEPQETHTALNDWVRYTAKVDPGRIYDVRGVAPLFSFYTDNGIIRNGAEISFPRGQESCAAAIDQLMSLDYVPEANSVYVLCLSPFSNYNAGTTLWQAYETDGGGNQSPTLNQIIGVPSYLNMSVVQHLYDYGRMDYIMGFIGILVTVGVYLNFTFGLIQRLLNLAVLYMISPITIAFYPFDEGSRFNSIFVQPFYKQVISSYAIVLSLNLFFVVFDVIRDSVDRLFTPTGAVMQRFFGLLTTIALISLLPKIRDYLTGALGADSIEQKSLGDAFKDAKGAVGSGVGQVAGAVKGAYGGAKGAVTRVGGVALGIHSRLTANSSAFNTIRNANGDVKRTQKEFRALKREKKKIEDGGFQNDGDRKRYDELTEEIETSRTQIKEKRKNRRDIKKELGGGSVRQIGRSIKEAVLVGDNDIAKVYTALSPQARIERLQKEEGILSKQQISKLDSNEIGVKQVNMAIDKEMKARRLEDELKNSPNLTDEQRVQRRNEIAENRRQGNEIAKQEGFAMDTERGRSAFNQMVDAEVAGDMTERDKIMARNINSGVGRMRNATGPAQQSVIKEQVDRTTHTIQYADENVKNAFFRDNSVKSALGDGGNIRGAGEAIRNILEGNGGGVDGFDDIKREIAKCRSANDIAKLKQFGEIANELLRVAGNPNGQTSMGVDGSRNNVAGHIANGILQAQTEYFTAQQRRLETEVDSIGKQIQEITRTAAQYKSSPILDTATKNAVAEIERIGGLDENAQKTQTEALQRAVTTVANARTGVNGRKLTDFDLGKLNSIANLGNAVQNRDSVTNDLDNVQRTVGNAKNTIVARINKLSAFGTPPRKP